MIFLLSPGTKCTQKPGSVCSMAKEKWLEDMPPYQSGGGMVDSVSFEKTTFADLPLKFEAGTGNYVGCRQRGNRYRIYCRILGMDEICCYMRAI